MARFAHFSKHSLKRIGQRTKLSYFLIADMLDYGRAIDVGKEVVFDRKHWLFYSNLDDCCFVAIQDSFTGLVITVLPLDYHQNLAWKVDSNSLIEAKEKASNYNQYDQNKSNCYPSIIIVKARYKSDDGYQKTVTLTKFKAADYNDDIYSVLKDKSFESEINYHCKLKGIDTMKIHDIAIALGNDGEPLTIDWNSDVEV